MADRPATYDDIIGLDAPDVAEALPQSPKAPTEEAEAPSFGEWFGAVARRDFTPYAIARGAVDAGIPWDENFDFETQVPKVEWEELTQGLPEDVTNRIADLARSREHLYVLASNAREAMQLEETINASGAVTGTAGRMIASVADPGNLALAVATGGVSVAAKADRIRRGLKAASSLSARRALVTEAGEAAGTSVGRNALAVGTVTAAESAAAEAVLGAGDATRDEWDPVYAAAGGMVLGGTLAGVLTRRETTQLRALHATENRRLEVLEAQDALQKRKDAIVAGLGDPDQSRAVVGKTHQEVGVFLSERDTDVGDYSRFRHILESGGKADAKASTSSATGVDQFLEGTWLGVVAQAKPAWAKGLSREALLELRKDPAKSAEMVKVLDEQNTAILRKANAPVNHFTLYAMHHFGPKRGKAFALAAPETKADDLFPEAVLKANPYLRGKTKAQIIANWIGRTRKGGVDFDGMIDRAPASAAEARRVAQLQAFDRDGATTRLAELEEQLEGYRAQRAQLSKEATEGALPSGEVRKLQREVDAIQKELRDHRGTPSGALKARMVELEAKLADLPNQRTALLDRFRAEDEASMGPGVAGTKQRTKLRESAVDLEIAKRQKALRAEFKAAKDARGRNRFALKEKLQGHEPKLAAHSRAAASQKALNALLKADPEKSITAEGTKLRAALGLADDLQRGVQADSARRADLKGLRGAVKGTEDDLDKLDALDNLGGELARRAAAGTSVDKETLSAARVAGFDPGLYPSLEDKAGGFPSVAQMKFGGVAHLFGKGTFSGVLRGNDNEVVRNLLGPLVSTVTGNADGSVVSVGADEITAGFARAWKGRFDAAVLNPYADWMKEQGVARIKKYNRTIREGFMRAVGDEIRNPQPDASPAVKKAASAVSGVFADVLKTAKEAGVMGFENVTENSNWLPRVFNFHATHALQERVGPEGIEQLIKGAMLHVAPDLDEAIAAKVAVHYFKRMRELRMGNDAGLMQGFDMGNAGFMRSFLEDTGVAPEEINRIMDGLAKLNLKNGPKDEGEFRHAKRRLQLDETFRARVRLKGTISDDPANFIEVGLSDLFDNNVEHLMGRYLRTMAGHTALAKVGIKGRTDFTERLQAVARELEGDLAGWKNVESRAKAAYDLLTARPLEDAGMWQEFTRLSRDLAFDTQMENAGLSNLPDMAALISWGNFRHTAGAFFRGDVFGAMWSRGENGRIKDELFQEIEEVWGIGTDHLNNQVFSAYDVGEEYAEQAVGKSGVVRKLSKGFASVGHGARVVGRGVSAGSGLAAISTFTQRIAARNIIYRIKDDVFKGGGISAKRAAALGLDDAMKKRIEQQMRDHTKWVEGDTGGRIQQVGISDWKDLDARDAFMYAVMRESKKNAQEATLGDTFLFQHKSLGKVLSQFRAFGLAAFSKQLLRGIAENDAEAYTRAAIQFMIAAGVWQFRHEAIAKGMELAGTDQDKIDKYREEKLSPGRIVAAGIRNSGTWALAPDVYDNVASITPLPVLFDVRNSGNSTTGLGQVPGASFWGNLQGALGGTSDALTGQGLSRETLRSWQGITPFGHHLLVAPAFEAVAQDLPTKAQLDKENEDDSWLNWL